MVYLDYAGAALPTRSQLKNIYEFSSSTVLANPHSTGPAASRTHGLHEEVRTLVLDHFHGHATEWNHGASSKKSRDARGLGYDLVFTSGATESMRIVAERFDWTSSCSKCGQTPQLAYAKQSHTSVLGMRGPAMASTTQVDRICKPVHTLIKDFELKAEWTQSSCVDCEAKRLLVLPLECNFTGERFHVTEAIENASRYGWYTFLDIAKAAATSPVDLQALNPDFAAVSFYKLFGVPTGLGSLFAKRSSVNALEIEKGGTIRRYFGGGSVDIAVPGSDFAIPRSEPSGLASISNGTIHFRGIAALRYGFEELQRYGGMRIVHDHTQCLAGELALRLRNLKHGNGTSVVQVYGRKDNVKAIRFGSIVAFTVFRSDRSPVGFNEVLNLAALNTPPIQLRAGCFCNPGACQEAIGVSDDEMIRRYRKEGHVCGGSVDLIDGEPTGAIRASFGKESLWEDLDALVVFIQRTYVEQNKSNCSVLTPTKCMPTNAVISELYIFPIKSCAAQRVQEWPMDSDTGKFVYDREFALVDSSGTAMRLQTYPCLTQLCPRIDIHSMLMVVSAPGQPDLSIDLTQDLSSCGGSDGIKVCGNRCGAVVWEDGAISAWFSAFVGVKCWLARFSKHLQQDATEKGFGGLNRVAFANESPLLLLSEQSLKLFNGVLEAQGQNPVSCIQFRPNIVVRLLDPNAIATQNPEDSWTTVKQVGSKAVSFSVVDHCARCAMVDFHPETGGKGRVFLSLARFRRLKGRITFGVFLQLATAISERDEKCLKEGSVFVCS